MKISLATLPILAAVWLPAPASLSAQTFTDDISILEVEVPVQVLVDGRSVRGLGRESFELLVDGELQELSWFEAIELGETLPGRATDTGAETPQSPDTPAAWQRHYLLLFDFGFSSRYRVQHAVRGMRQMVESQSHPTDRLAIALFAEPIGARILVPFTTDRRGIELGFQFLESVADAKPKKSLDRLEALDAWWRGTADPGSLPEPLLADMGRAAGTLIQPLARPVEPAGVGLPLALDADGEGEPSSRYRTARLDSLFMQQGGSLSTVRALGRSMASLVTLLRDVPEPKHLLFLSRGLGSLFNDTETVTPVLHRLKPMVDAFGDTGWTLQAIDTDGIPPPPTTVLTGPEDFGSSTEVGLGRVATAGSDNSSLFYLANETGGELFENYNRIHKATGKILDRTRATYLLAFQPTDLGNDGERYDIEVRLKPEIPNARVVHRPGFRAPRPALDRLLAERRMDAAELALSGRTLDELRVRVLPLALPEPEGGRVPIFIELETDRLDTGKKGRKRVRLDVHAFVVDPAGRVRAGFARELRFGLEGERTVGLAEEVSLPPGRHELRLLAWDLRGHARHLSHTPVDVVPAGPASVRLSGPHFLASADRRRQFSRRATDRDGALGLFELHGELAAVDPLPRIERRRSRRFLVLAPGWTEAGEGELRVRLLAADGTTLDGEIGLDRLEDGADGTARFSGVLATGERAAGRYRLEASLENTAGATVVATAGFEIVEPAATQSR